MESPSLLLSSIALRDSFALLSSTEEARNRHHVEKQRCCWKLGRHTRDVFVRHVPMMQQQSCSRTSTSISNLDPFLSQSPLPFKPHPLIIVPGTYGEEAGLGSVAQCTPCTEGSYCAQTGLTAVEGDCVEGYYCPRGSEVSPCLQVRNQPGMVHRRGPKQPEHSGVHVVGRAVEILDYVNLQWENLQRAYRTLLRKCVGYCCKTNNSIEFRSFQRC